MNNAPKNLLENLYRYGSNFNAWDMSLRQEAQKCYAHNLDFKKAVDGESAFEKLLNEYDHECVEPDAWLSERIINYTRRNASIRTSKKLFSHFPIRTLAIAAGLIWGIGFLAGYLAFRQDQDTQAPAYLVSYYTLTNTLK